jgi:hypothetical protein
MLIQKIQSRLVKVWLRLKYQLSRAIYAHRLPVLSCFDQAIVDELNQEGVAVRSLDQLLLTTTPSLRRTFAPLVRDLQVPAIHRDPEVQVTTANCVSIHPQRIAQAYPDLYLWGLSDRLLNIVENYIGLPTVYHGVLARQETPNGQQVLTRLWHTDREDPHMVRINIYVNDVGIADGPFEYIPKALTPSLRHFKKFGYRITDAVLAKVVAPRRWRACPGAAGTVVFAATGQVLHHGKVPVSDYQRIAVSYYYTGTEPTGAALCEEYSFMPGLPHLRAELSRRQRQALGKYQALLPALLDGRSPIEDDLPVRLSPQPMTL